MCCLLEWGAGFVAIVEVTILNGVIGHRLVSLTVAGFAVLREVVELATVGPVDNVVGGFPAIVGGLLLR
jgi:UPF0716 family protein affecting phage T7 exclusion